MAKLTLDDIAAGYVLVATINNNNALIEAALENTLSRDGTTPNTMSASLDMNSQKIVNLPVPVADSEAASKKYIDDLSIALSTSGDFSDAIAYNFSNQIDFYGAGGIRVQDTGQTDWIQISHDGADIDIDGTNTTDINIKDGMGLNIFATNNTDSFRMVHDGTAFIMDGNLSNGIRLGDNLNMWKSGSTPKISWYDSTQTNNCGILVSGNDLVTSNSGLDAFILDLPLKITEAAAAVADSAGDGQLWVRDDAPNALMFTDDTGIDYLLNSQSKLKISDESITNDAALSDDAELAGFSVIAGKHYTIDAWIRCVDNGGDIRFAGNFSQTPVSQVWTWQGVNGTTNAQVANTSVITTSMPLIQTDAQNYYYHIKGRIRAHATVDGTFSIQWSQNASNAGATVVQGDSWLTLTEVPG